MSSQATEIESWRVVISKSWGPETRDLLEHLEGEGLHLSIEGGELVCVPDPGREDILRDADVRELVWARRHDLEAALRDPKRDLRGIRLGPYGVIARKMGFAFETGPGLDADDFMRRW